MKNIVIGIVAVAALVVGVVAYNKPVEHAVGAQGAQGIQGPKGDRGAIGPQGPAGKDASRLGSATGPIFPFPYISVGGVKSWFSNGTFLQGSTTVCSLQSPVATSSLRFASIQPTSATSTAVTITASKATNLATSSGAIIATSTIAANALGNLPVATTTAMADSALGRLTLSDRVFAPSTYLNVSYTGGQGGFNVSGSCIAEWTELQ